MLYLYRDVVCEFQFASIRTEYTGVPYLLVADHPMYTRGVVVSLVREPKVYFLGLRLQC